MVKINDLLFCFVWLIVAVYRELSFFFLSVVMLAIANVHTDFRFSWSFITTLW